MERTCLAGFLMAIYIVLKDPHHRDSRGKRKRHEAQNLGLNMRNVWIAIWRAMLVVTGWWDCYKNRGSMCAYLLGRYSKQRISDADIYGEQKRSEEEDKHTYLSRGTALSSQVWHLHKGMLDVLRWGYELVNVFHLKNIFVQQFRFCQLNISQVIWWRNSEYWDEKF